MADYSDARRTVYETRRSFKGLAVGSEAAKAGGTNFPPRRLYDRMMAIEALLDAAIGGNVAPTLREPAAIQQAATTLQAYLQHNPLSEGTSSARLQAVSDLIANVEYLTLGAPPAAPSLAAEIKDLAQRLADTEDAEVRAELVEAFADKMTASLNTVDSTIQQILLQERQAGAAKQSAETSATEALTQQNSTQTAAQKLTALATEAGTQSELLKGKLSKADELLKKTSQLALAKSFHDRKDDLRWPLLRWGALFVIGTTALALLAFYEINWAPERLTFNDGWSSLLAIVGRLLIAGPMIWLLWFAARQFGQTVRLREDYAFKEAAAMAFVGYRDEMGDDADMLKLLRGAAIQAFGDNPVRILVNQPDHSSPVSEVLEKLKIEQLLELLTKALDALTKKGS